MKKNIYVDVNRYNLEKILMMHSLPKKSVTTSLPLVLSKNVVGHIFHKYTRTLEMDIFDSKTDDVVGNSFCENIKKLKIYEDAAAPTVGYTVCTDEGKTAQKTFLIKDNTIVGFLDSFLYPYTEGSCGYLGYGKSYFPLPRSANLCVQEACEPVILDDYLEVTAYIWSCSL